MAVVCKGIVDKSMAKEAFVRGDRIYEVVIQQDFTLVLV